jgi:flavorubredoxin
MLNGQQAQKPFSSLSPMPHGMEAFHRRYMVSNKILRFWARMVRQLPINMIVPQHGAPLEGAAVKEFIDWVEGLSCGIDIMTDAIYAVPR